MTSPPIGTDEELIERLRKYGHIEAADALLSRIAEVERLRERVMEAMGHLFNAADLLEAEGWQAVASEKREIAHSLKAALSQHGKV